MASLHDHDRASALGELSRFRREFYASMTARADTLFELTDTFDEQLARMFTFFGEHPSELFDLSALRTLHPGLMSLDTWLQTTGWNPERLRRANTLIMSRTP